jgi:tetratricopeptide (TPR) repeat protein
VDKAVVEEVRRITFRGIAAMRQRLPDEASRQFATAIQLVNDLRDDRTRRDELARLAGLLDRCGFPDLSLRAAEAAVDLDRALGLDHLRADDLLTAGNAHMNLGDQVSAEAAYRQALAIFVDERDFANAAAAATNIAGVVATRGEMAPAIDLLEQSLEYLAREPFADIELQTRLALLQAMELELRDADRAVENARQLYARFWDIMPATLREPAREFLGKAVERYLDAHRDISPDAWKARNFPKLYV